MDIFLGWHRSVFFMKFEINLLSRLFKHAPLSYRLVVLQIALGIIQLRCLLAICGISWGDFSHKKTTPIVFFFISFATSLISNWIGAKGIEYGEKQGLLNKQVARRLGYSLVIPKLFLLMAILLFFVDSPKEFFNWNRGYIVDLPNAHYEVRKNEEPLNPKQGVELEILSLLPLWGKCLTTRDEKNPLLRPYQIQWSKASSKEMYLQSEFSLMVSKQSSWHWKELLRSPHLLKLGLKERKRLKFLLQSYAKKEVSSFSNENDCVEKNIFLLKFLEDFIDSSDDIFQIPGDANVITLPHWEVVSIKHNAALCFFSPELEQNPIKEDI